MMEVAVASGMLVNICPTTCGLSHSHIVPNLLFTNVLPFDTKLMFVMNRMLLNNSRIINHDLHSKEKGLSLYNII
jgi:hypothetical protein